VAHRRTICVRRPTSYVRIVDRLTCREAHDVELFLHFHDQCEVRQLEATRFEATHGQARLAMQLASSLECELYRGSEAPMAGWTSERFGVKTPAYTIRARASIRGETEFITMISAC